MLTSTVQSRERPCQELEDSSISWNAGSEAGSKLTGKKRQTRVRSSPCHRHWLSAGSSRLGEIGHIGNLVGLK
jgi:hypothetical protein